MRPRIRDRMLQRERGAKKKVGRLTLREEGKFWNAYYAPEDMKGALLLGSIRLRMIEDIDRRNEFVDLMQKIVHGITTDAMV